MRAVIEYVLPVASSCTLGVLQLAEINDKLV